jgi:hypothetical protein
MKKFQEHLVSEASQVVGKTILQQIRMIDRMALMAWGAKQFITSDVGGLAFDKDNSKARKKNYKHLGYLKFKVSGLKYKGWVLVALNGKDLYDVYYYRVRGADAILDDIDSDVYAEDLVNIIDAKIEKS